MDISEKRFLWQKAICEADFTLHNFPFGCGVLPNETAPRALSAFGYYALDLEQAYRLGLLGQDEKLEKVLGQPYLNNFIALGRSVAENVRDALQQNLSLENPSDPELSRKYPWMIPMDQVRMTLPVRVPNYTDFYSSLEHATNLGRMFRPGGEPLLPNWRHMPIGYHGRASSIVVSGTPIRRPWGQVMPEGAEKPVFSPTRLLDIELEFAFVVGQDTILGNPVPVDEAWDYIFGFVLFNDWSARDIQKWEYQPLGPFLGKNFGSTISPWIVTAGALEPFRTEGPTQEPEVLPYLRTQGPLNYDIELNVYLEAPNAEPALISVSNTRYLYWNAAQQLAHHTVNGCNIQVGDIYASGTISAPYRGGEGSLIELTQKGTAPITLPDGSLRRFLEDGDTIHFRGYASRGDVSLGFGLCSGQILQPLQLR
ncbi:MAG: fumarylacetoacetase [Flavobacteriales bacterium]|nr:fumarylacetoacetase [Flavobacteriales bacterium]MCX7650600.1 fumarylacetoacetase [Flavobacteriales bacterium]MDW8431552.1 fumarylacetoacetase [Flavobacteriales bacterium]